MRERTREAIGRYLDEELGRSVQLPDIEELNRQRENFLRQFGPERLAGMSGDELLDTLPHSISNEQPMDYWLEFRKDETFTSRLFGGIGGGSAAKFGAWQEKSSGNWRAKRPNDPLASVLRRVL